MSASGVAFGHHQQAIHLVICAFRRLHEVKLQTLWLLLLVIYL
nr:MAG TPA: hypothetical protein [Herelleviridae sp.]